MSLLPKNAVWQFLKIQEFEALLPQKFYLNIDFSPFVFLIIIKIIFFFIIKHHQNYKIAINIWVVYFFFSCLENGCFLMLDIFGTSKYIIKKILNTYKYFSLDFNKVNVCLNEFY